MPRFTQISTLAMFAVLASTAFVATAEAGPKKIWCKQTSSILFRTACEEQKRYYQRPLSYVPGQPVVNFRGRTSQEMGTRNPAGGANGGAGGGTGGGNGAAGGRP